MRVTSETFFATVGTSEYSWTAIVRDGHDWKKAFVELDAYFNPDTMEFQARSWGDGRYQLYVHTKPEFRTKI